MKRVKSSLGMVIVAVFALTVFGACGDGGAGDSVSDLSDTVKEVVDDTKSETVVTTDDKESDNSDVSNSEEETAEKEEASEKEEEKDPYDDFDRATQNAVESARNYLSFTAFSKKGLIDQLSSEYGDGYTEEQAKTAVQYLEDQKEVNWKKQAVKAAENYLSFTSFSRQGLIDQLSSDYGDKFTKKQAEYAADKVGL